MLIWTNFDSFADASNMSSLLQKFHLLIVVVVNSIESLRNKNNNGNVNRKWQNYSNAHVHAMVIPKPRCFLTTCQT